jgi:hypothetical protein
MRKICLQTAFLTLTEETGCADISNLVLKFI